MKILMDSTLPPRNQHFVGQEVPLQSIDHKLQCENRVALVGIGGSGYTYFIILIHTSALFVV